MTINEAMKSPLFLKNPSTEEGLEMLWRSVLRFGNYILLAGHYWKGPGNSSYFGAVYEFLSEDHSCEGPVGLAAVSDIEFVDAGHAIQWAIEEVSK